MVIDCVIPIRAVNRLEVPSVLEHPLPSVKPHIQYVHTPPAPSQQMTSKILAKLPFFSPLKGNFILYLYQNNTMWLLSDPGSVVCNTPPPATPSLSFSFFSPTLLFSHIDCNSLSWSAAEILSLRS